MNIDVNDALKILREFAFAAAHPDTFIYVGGKRITPHDLALHVAQEFTGVQRSYEELSKLYAEARNREEKLKQGTAQKPVATVVGTPMLVPYDLHIHIEDRRNLTPGTKLYAAPVDLQATVERLTNDNLTLQSRLESTAAIATRQSADLRAERTSLRELGDRYTSLDRVHVENLHVLGVLKKQNETLLADCTSLHRENQCLKERYDCNTAIMQARTGIMNQRNDVVREFAKRITIMQERRTKLKSLVSTLQRTVGNQTARLEEQRTLIKSLRGMIRVLQAPPIEETPVEPKVCEQCNGRGRIDHCIEDPDGIPCPKCSPLDTQYTQAEAEAAGITPPTVERFSMPAEPKPLCPYCKTGWARGHGRCLACGNTLV